MKNDRNDVMLQQGVLDELDWEPSVNAADIGVTVQEGIVTLTGYVPSFAEKRAAEQAALRVAGVKAVAEEIKVRLPGTRTRTDAEIARAAVDAITWHVFLQEEQVKVKVQDGIITLEGNVEWQYQKDQAVDAVRTLTGVKGVFNLIKVKPLVTPAGIKEKIRKALERTAHEDAEHITVNVQEDEVTLGGNVRTWSEREDAVRAAWSAPGVTNVKNNIAIRPFSYA